MGANLLVCIPAYNEEDTISAVLDSILPLRGEPAFDVLVVDDGSEDATRELCEQGGVSVISHIYNMGYGAALKTAYKYAARRNYDYLIQIDADGQHDPCNIKLIYDALTGLDAPDIVIGSRFLEGSVSFKVPIHKRIVMAFFNMIIKSATGKKTTDPTSGLQGLSRGAFTLYSRFNCFAIDYPDANMVIQMALKGFAVKEIPAVMHARHSGKSMHPGLWKPMKYIFQMTLSVLSVWIREGRVRKGGAV